MNKAFPNGSLSSGLERPKASTEEVSASSSREFSGAAKPHDGGERQLLHSLGILDAPRDPKFDSITRLLCTVFNVPTALVSLTNSDKPRLRTTPCLFLLAEAAPCVHLNYPDRVSLSLCTAATPQDRRVS